MSGTEQTLESQLVLILDDDLMITEGLAAGLQREGRTIVTCNDLESAQLAVERLTPSHIVTDVRLSGPFAYEGLDFIRFARRHTPESQVILITGDAPEALQLEASERGAVAFLQKPFDITELNSILELLSCSVRSSAALETPLIRMPILDDILASESLRPLFQPIVTLGEGYPCIGYESLARYHDNPLFRNPEVLFQYASRKERIADLEVACVSRSLAHGAKLARGHLLFFNIHPEVISHGTALCEVIKRDSRQFGVPLDHIVLEITEQGSLNSKEELFENVEELHRLGVRFAFDDLGVAYSHLPLIDKIRPDFLKISQDFGTAFEADATKLKIVMNLKSLARDFGCELIVEGIEQASTANFAERMGIKYGQGFYFARPAEASSFLS